MFKNNQSSSIILRSTKAFTLIELVIVMVILGILAVVAIPRFQDLSTEANVAATQAGLGSVRSAVTIRYAALGVTGSTSLPTQIVASDFPGDRMPVNQLNNQSAVQSLTSQPAGTATSGSSGWWYMTNTGIVGAYSDGSEDTTSW